MIDPKALLGIPFPWIFIENSGRVIAEGAGALFPAPSYSTEVIAQQAMRIKDGGWSTCSHGYALHRFTTPAIAPGFILLHGLKVAGVSSAQGKSEVLSIRLSASEVEDFVESYRSSIEALDDQYRSLIRQNIHEVRGINSALYNTAFGLQSLLENHQHAPITKSIVSLSELLRARIDFMEFIANPSAQQVKKTEISVYRKFDKLMRCFKGSAFQKRITFDMLGSSANFVYGPPIFDLVPYLLLDNALKYAPENSNVKIVCNDSDRAIFCTVSSLGPRIAEDELRDIFLPYVRGKNAKKSGVSGSGLGLAALKNVVEEIFAGSVKVSQPSTDSFSMGGVPYCQVTFDLKFPTQR